MIDKKSGQVLKSSFYGVESIEAINLQDFIPEWASETPHQPRQSYPFRGSQVHQKKIWYFEDLPVTPKNFLELILLWITKKVNDLFKNTSQKYHTWSWINLSKEDNSKPVKYELFSMRCRVSPILTITL